MKILDRTAEQERLPVNKGSHSTACSGKNESVIESRGKSLLYRKTGCDPSGGLFGEFEDLFNSEDVHIKEQIKQDMSPDSLPGGTCNCGLTMGLRRRFGSSRRRKADEEEIAPAINENTAEKMEEEIPVERQ